MTKEMKCGPRNGLIEKLHPTRLRVSPKFHAILACLLGQADWTTPALTAVCITRDGHVLGESEDDIGFNLYLGAEADLIRNVEGVLLAVAASQTETGYLLAQVEKHRI